MSYSYEICEGRINWLAIPKLAREAICHTLWCPIVRVALYFLNDNYQWAESVHLEMWCLCNWSESLRLSVFSNWRMCDARADLYTMEEATYVVALWPSDVVSSGLDISQCVGWISQKIQKIILSVDLWMKGCVKSRVLMLRRCGCIHAPFYRQIPPA